MQTFTIGPGRNWCIRALGRNPLTRTTDRIEAIAVVLAILVALIAVPVAGAVGTSIHETRMRMYTQQANTRHIVSAVATADSIVDAHPRSVSFIAMVKWSAAGGDHVATLIREQPVRAGDRLDIWVDEAGAMVSAPVSPGRASWDAAGAAVSLWLGVVGVAAGITYAIRWSLDRRRYAQWEREISAPADGNEGRTNHQP